MAALKRGSRRYERRFDECEKKALRSCARCRKNKTKCDSMETRPNPCSSCMKKGVECRLDYVTPPQRSKEMKYLYESIRFASDKISSLCVVYEDFLKEFELKNSMKSKKEEELNEYPTRILKIRDQFFSFNLNPIDESLCINNFRIKSEFWKKSFKNFRELLWGLISIYFKWEKIDTENEEKALKFVSEFSPKFLLQKNQLLSLLCILNFYYDIPGLKYLDIFEYVIESYYVGASGNGGSKEGEGQNENEEDEIGNEEGKYLSKNGLANVIVGNLPNAQFHSELFIKNFTILLFLNIILYGPEYFMSCFMDKYIRTLEYLRKKINFDKNWEVKWVNFYIRLLNLVEGVVPSVENDKFAVDDDEIDFLFSLVRKDREVDGRINVTLDCFICLVKFDQYLIERREWPQSKEICRCFQYICGRLNSDILKVFGVKGNNSQEYMERFSFMQLFFVQFLTLNNILCVSYCGGTSSVFNVDFNIFNGFNYDLYEIIPEELVGNNEGCVEVESGLYWCQSKYDFLKDLLMKNEDMNVSELVFLFVEVAVGRHCLNIDTEFGVFEMVNEDLERFCMRDDVNLRMLKCSCRLVWLLYEFVVFWDMVNRLVVYEPFVWNSQLLLENNGLMCQNGDVRSHHYGDSVLDLCYGMDVVDEDDEEGVLKKDRLNEEESPASEVVVSEPLEMAEGTEVVSLNGGINRILQNVDWVKESADEVFEKIHNVLK